MDRIDNIFSTIRGEIDDFMYNSIEVVPAYTFNQYDTIKRCHLYLNSRFEDNTPYQNREKMFFNICKYRRDIAGKFLNIDTKDIRLWEMNPKSKWSTFLLEKELKLWMKRNKIGILLNDAAMEAPSYGSVVVKKTKKAAQLVDLRRLFLDPTVDRIQNSRFITIKHLLTTAELKEKIKDGWDEEYIESLVEEKYNELQKSNAPMSYETNGMQNAIRSSPYFEVYERFGEVPKYYFTGKMRDTEYIRSVFIVCDPYNIWKDNEGHYRGENGKVLFKSKWTGAYPFKDFHYNKTPGRWLGIGVVEDLFTDQERRNELTNQKRVSMEISSIHLFQTPGKSIVNNILADLKSGDLLESGLDGDIKPVVNEERNFNAFRSEQEDFDAHADLVSFANSQTAGEALAASTPATNAVIQQNNITSIFGFKRENYALFLQEFFNDFVLDQVLKDLTDEHILRFTGTPEDLQRLDQGYIDVLTRDFILRTVFETKRVPSTEEIEGIKQGYQLILKKEGGTRFINVKEGFYDDIEFEFDIMVSSEQENVAVVAQNLFQILSAVGQNPTLLQNPVTKAFIFEYAQKIGVNPLKLEVAESQQAPMAQGIPSPLPNGGQQPVGQGQPQAQLTRGPR